MSSHDVLKDPKLSKDVDEQLQTKVAQTTTESTLSLQDETENDDAMVVAGPAGSLESIRARISEKLKKKPQPSSKHHVIATSASSFMLAKEKATAADELASDGMGKDKHDTHDRTNEEEHAARKDSKSKKGVANHPCLPLSAKYVRVYIYIWYDA